jgi:hypothetical protein
MSHRKYKPADPTKCLGSGMKPDFLGCAKCPICKKNVKITKFGRVPIHVKDSNYQKGYEQGSKRWL